jgi:predicted membrane-bound dolichyl-phosphate-mannose-protein mannosyltransferase
MNVGTFDRFARFAAGIVLIVLSFVPPSAPLIAAPGLWKWVVVAAGIILIATAATRFCPAYSVFGFNTCQRS